MAIDNKELKKAISQALKKPRNFVLTFKGRDVRLHLSKKKIPPKKALDLKSEIGATKSFEGVCQGDDEGFTFKSIEPVPVALAPIMRNYIKAETGLSTAPRFVTVTALDVVDDDEPETDDPAVNVDPGKSSIDVDARLYADTPIVVENMRAHLVEQNAGRKKCVEALNVAKAGVVEAKKKAGDVDVAIGEVQNSGAPQANVQDRLKELNAQATEYQTFITKAVYEMKEAAKKVSEFDKHTKEYPAMLAAYDAVAADKPGDSADQVFAKQKARAEAVQGAQLARIKAVREAMAEVYKKTEQKLMILGRLPHTLGSNDPTIENKSWLKAHEGQGQDGRVLAAKDWSMAVNDAFVKSGLDQKAQVLLATEFNEHEEKDRGQAYDPDVTNNIIKSLSRDVRNIIATADPTKTKQEIKDEVRQLITDKFVVELQGNPKQNEGFSIYMLEIEQLIDDNYVMMIHNPEDDGNKNPKVNPNALGDGDQVPEGAEQVMVPSGTGQKIKEELAKAADEKHKSIAAREDILSDLRAILSDPDKKQRISKDSDATALAKEIVNSVKKERYDLAKTSLAGLQDFCATAAP